MPRVTSESQMSRDKSVIELTKEIVKMKTVLDDKGAKPDGRKLELHMDAWKKLRESLTALNGFLNCEIIASSNVSFAKMWGWTE